MAKKDGKDNELAILAPLAFLVIVAFLSYLAIINISFIVPKDKYMQGLVKYADKGIKNFEKVRFPLFISSLESEKQKIIVLHKKLKDTSKFLSEYAHKNKDKLLNHLFSKSKDEKVILYKKKLSEFVRLYWDFLILRVKIIFHFIMSEVIVNEVEVILAIFFLLLVVVGRVFIPTLWVKIFRERAIREFLKLLFLAPEDGLGIIEKHPVSGRYTPNVDKFREFFDGVMKGKKVKADDPFDVFKDDAKAIKMLKAMGSVLLLESMAVFEKDGKVKILKNEGYPASITGNHNPHPKFGLLMHSLMVAYCSVRIAALNGLTNKRELLNVFYAGAVHDAGKIRLYKKVLSKPAVVNSLDAVEGDKYIKEAKKAKPIEKWKSWASSTGSVFNKEEAIQANILISKLGYKVFPDETVKENFVKPADHICVDAELRYSAMTKKERKAFFEKILKEFFKDSKTFNSFDENMIGIVSGGENGKAGVILATLATRLINTAIPKLYNKQEIERLKLLVPIRRVSFQSGSKGGKLRPFSYTLSQYLYENGYIYITHDEDMKCDSVGLYDVLVSSRAVGRLPYNACWVLSNFDEFCRKHRINPEIVNQDTKILEIYERKGTLSDPLCPADIEEPSDVFEESTIDVFADNKESERNGESGGVAATRFGGDENKESVANSENIENKRDSLDKSEEDKEKKDESENAGAVADSFGGDEDKESVADSNGVFEFQEPPAGIFESSELEIGNEEIVGESVGAVADSFGGNEDKGETVEDKSSPDNKSKQSVRDKAIKSIENADEIEVLNLTNAVKGKKKTKKEKKKINNLQQEC